MIEALIEHLGGSHQGQRMLLAVRLSCSRNCFDLGRLMWSLKYNVSAYVGGLDHWPSIDFGFRTRWHREMGMHWVVAEGRGGTVYRRQWDRDILDRHEVSGRVLATAQVEASRWHHACRLQGGAL